MAKKKVEKEELVTDRKGLIRKTLLEVLKDKRLFKGGIFEAERCFDVSKVVELPGTRGFLREKLSDFKPEEKKIYREVLQDLKNEGVLFHKTGSQWAWCREN